MFEFACGMNDFDIFKMAAVLLGTELNRWIKAQN